MKVVVCGGRSFSNKDAIWKALSAIHAQQPIEELAHGCSSGADMHADGWAEYHRVPTMRFVPNWQIHGRAAGPIRNREMLELIKPRIVIAFPGGAGTEDCKEAAREMGIPIIEPLGTGGT